MSERYLTQMQAARMGVMTSEMECALSGETISPEDLLKGVASGSIAIPANRSNGASKPCGFGAGLKTKINVNLGFSPECRDLEAELDKVRLSSRLGADAVMDLSIGAGTESFRRKVRGVWQGPLGTVPVYEAAARAADPAAELTVDHLLAVVEEHAADGVDFMTIHAGLTLECANRLRGGERVTDVVSRGGSVLLEWMLANGEQNPFFEHFDRVLDICQRHDVTISLGDGLRPGCLADATDAAQISELLTLGELTRRAWDADVQVMIEGPGHVPMHEVAANVQLAKKLCHGAPLYVLGPLVVDVAPGYDHITAAIGGALAAWHGADFLCYVTPAEHLRLPSLEDVEEGIVASKIAGHAADIAKGLPTARSWDDAMSHARRQLDWPKMIDLALDPEKPRRYLETSAQAKGDVCSMCGELCAVKRSSSALRPPTDCVAQDGDAHELRRG